MKQVTITDNIGTNQKVVRMQCSCEWVEKTSEQHKWAVSKTHINSRHGGNGRVVYKNERRNVENGVLGPIRVVEATNGGV